MQCLALLLAPGPHGRSGRSTHAPGLELGIWHSGVKEPQRYGNCLDVDSGGTANGSAASRDFRVARHLSTVLAERSAGDVEHLPGGVPGLLAGKEGNGVRDVVGGSGATHGNGGDAGAEEVGV